MSEYASTRPYDSGESRLPPQPLLQRLLEVRGGRLYYRERPAAMFPTPAIARSWNAQHADKLADTAKHPGGYREVVLFGKKRLAHRVIFKLLHGYEPHQIDHDDGDKGNNNPDNLKPADQPKNSRNQSKSRKNASGVTGVHWDAKNKRWFAQITYGRRPYFIGRFKTIEEAKAAREAKEKEFGFSATHGRRAKQYVKGLETPAPAGR